MIFFLQYTLYIDVSETIEDVLGVFRLLSHAVIIWILSIFKTINTIII